MDTRHALKMTIEMAGSDWRDWGWGSDEHVYMWGIYWALLGGQIKSLRGFSDNPIFIMGWHDGCGMLNLEA